MNTQPPEKAAPRGLGAALDVVSIFRTIQGEGPFVGQRSIFIRLAGCNLQCPRCDTDYTTGRNLYSAVGILDRIKLLQSSMQHAPLIVITGGEPFRQDLTELFKLLYDAGYLVQVETNGTYPPVGQNNRVSIVCSPKTGSVHGQIERHAIAYKYVLRHVTIMSDGLPGRALDHPAAPYVARPPARLLRKHIYVQPEDSGNAATNQRNLEAARKSCLEFGYTLGLQIHKLIGVP